MAARLLCVGDLHLGRRAGGLPDDATLAERGLSPGALGPAAALANVVEWALRERPDAVVLAGDVVDSENGRFEAWRPLRESAMRLQEARIDLVGVAGNHDVEALPRLARTLTGFHLLGARGAWELHPVLRDGQPVAHLLGWSFPQAKVAHSPLQGLDAGALLAGASTPVLGLLHAHLDASKSVYAPVSRAALAALTSAHAALVGWVLGHEHVPSLALEGAPLGYLGSATALDASESGRHGPWLLELGDDGGLSRRHLPLSPMRWESLQLDVKSGPRPLDEHDPGTDLMEWILASLAAQLEPPESDDRCLLLGVRVELVGSTPHHRALAAAVQHWNSQPPGLHEVAGRTLFVQRVRAATRPRRDLDALARGNDPPGLLARRILLLEQGGGEAEALLVRARRALDSAVRASDYGSVSAPAALSPDHPGALRELLSRAARDALEELLASSEGAAP